MDFQEAQESAIDLLQTLITIPSYSREEVTRADYLQKYIESRGYLVNRRENNLWIIAPGFDESKPTLLLNSHIDTVRPTSGWTKEPHVPVVERGMLFGLGSNDAGASLVLSYTPSLSFRNVNNPTI